MFKLFPLSFCLFLFLGEGVGGWSNISSILRVQDFKGKSKLCEVHLILNEAF